MVPSDNSAVETNWSDQWHHSFLFAALLDDAVVCEAGQVTCSRKDATLSLHVVLGFVRCFGGNIPISPEMCICVSFPSFLSSLHQQINVTRPQSTTDVLLLILTIGWDYYLD